jgi:SprT protein
VWADALLRLHLDDSWSFAFDHATKRAGLCDYGRKRISISRHLAARWDDDEVHQTLLHEVAHAIAGPGTGHGAQWRRVADELGYVGGTTHSGEIAVERARWHGRCAAGHEFVRFRRPARTVSCGACSRRFDPANIIHWVDRRAA